MTDTTPEAIYVAVGYATSKWETLEAHLSFMFSIFEGNPLDRDILRNYGREAKIFNDRIASLRKSACKYFRSAPNQHEEARVEAMIAEAVRLSNFRHRIAHGIVSGQELTTHDEYRLVPPDHGLFHLTKRDGYYAYSSDDIKARAREFTDLAAQVQAFNHERHSPALAKSREQEHERNNGVTRRSRAR